MARTQEAIISEMVDSGLFTDDEIRQAVAQAQQPTLAEKSSQAITSAFTKGADVLSSPSTYAAPLARPITAGAKVVAGNPEGALEALPAIGAVAGSTVMPLGGGAIGAGLGEALKQGGRRVLGKPAVSSPPRIPFLGEIPDIPGIPVPASRIAIESALGGAGDLLGVAVGKFLPKMAASAKETALDAGRRALGFTKGFLNRPGGVEKANQVAGEMLEAGVITPKGTQEMLDRAETVSGVSGKQVGDFIKNMDEQGVKSFNVGDATATLEKELLSGFKGGLYDEERRIVKKITDTVKAHGEDNIKFSDVQSILETLRNRAGFKAADPTSEQLLYRRAYGILNEARSKSVDAAVDEVARSGFSIPGVTAAAKRTYDKAKKVYGAAEQAQRSLTNRLSSEEGNKLIGLTDTIAGAGQLAAGDVAGALRTVGVKKAVERFGAATTARGANAISKALSGMSSLPNTAISQALIQALTRPKKKK